MQIDRQDLSDLINLLQGSEDWLISRILFYAERQNYTKYTSTLKEAWRLSIEGLSQAMIQTLHDSNSVHEMGPDDDCMAYPDAAFGILEAKRHRARGVTIAMFLGLLKYYRQSYLDLLEKCAEFKEPEPVKLFVRRFFDRVELGYCTEWAGSAPEAQIKELSSANRHLANEKNKYLTLFESLSSPVILCDMNGKIHNYNHAAGRLFLGDDASGAHYYAPAQRVLEPPGLQAEMGRLLSEQIGEIETEKVYDTPAGRKTFDVHIERMLDVSHKFSGYTILFNDITERQEWARRMEDVNRKQKTLISDLNRTRAHLVHSEKMASIGRLAAGVAHEINTPTQFVNDNTHFLQTAFEDLAILAGDFKQLLAAADSHTLSKELVEDLHKHAEELDLDFLTTEIPAAIKQSLEGIKRISDIVLAMKEFSHPGQNKKSWTDINSAVKSTIQVARNEWKYHAVIETDLDPDLPLVPCMPGDFNQAVLNIIVNAAHATSSNQGSDAADKGTISIATRQEQGQAVVSISDSGPGIPEDIRSKIFDPFFTTKEIGKGTGQGLAIAYSAIVDKHAGSIDIESEIGKGATFTIRIPLFKEEAQSA